MFIPALANIYLQSFSINIAYLYPFFKLYSQMLEIFLLSPFSRIKRTLSISNNSVCI